MAKVSEVLDGLYPAVVTSSEDPLKMGRVKVRFPWLDDSAESWWARVVQPYAGKERGMFFMPEVGDEVVVCFELGDVHQPLVIGMTWNGADATPEPGDADGQNHFKIIETRSGHKLQFGDEPGAEFIQLNDSSLNNIVRWDSVSNTISITAKTGNIYIKAPTGAINLKAREIFVNATDSAKRTVGANEQITVKQHAVEVAKNSKNQTSSTSFSVSVPNTTIGASSSMSFSGGSAKVQLTAQENDKVTVAGATTEVTGNLEVTSTEVFEKAPTRTWTTGVANLNAQSVMFDASATVTVTAGMFNCTAQGEVSFMGNMVATLGGLMLYKGGQIAMNPSPSPPIRGAGNNAGAQGVALGMQHGGAG